MIGKLRSWRRLSAAERRAVRELYVLIPLTHRALKVAGFKRVKEYYDRRYIERGARPDVSAHDVIARYRRALRIVDRNRYRQDRCLARSIVLQAMLRREGAVTELRIGHRRRDGKFEAHAWLDFGGSFPFEAESDTYSYEVFRQLLHKP